MTATVVLLTFSWDNFSTLVPSAINCINMYLPLALSHMSLNQLYMYNIMVHTAEVSSKCIYIYIIHPYAYLLLTNANTYLIILYSYP